MNRRQFLYQAISVSAVAMGAGYASLDMVRRSTPEWTESQADKARKAAAQALRGSPEADEGLMLGHVDAESLQKPETSKVEPHERSAQEPDRSARSEQAVDPTAPDATAATPEQGVEAPATAAPEPERSVADVAEPSSDSPSTAPAEVAEIPRIEVISDPPPVVVEESDVIGEVPETLAEAVDDEEKMRQRIEHFDYDFSDDIYITEAEYTTLISILERLNRVEAYVGHGNFNVLAFEDMLRYGRYQSRIGAFTPVELEYMEKLFYDDVRRLGFFGERVIDNLQHRIAPEEISKIPRSGHFLFRGHAENFYNRVTAEVGDSLILTSGVRGIVKQYHLFMARVVRAEGNLSRASRSLAPPGHSYHALGDFDVGVVGGGLSNFTADFANTDEYKRLLDLGFVDIRYTEDNRFGVRFEPWHIRVV
ncbi:MAG: D-alanyl-D-alanine carboxypeptidase family protein [Saccharospirillum sp.]